MNDIFTPIWIVWEPKESLLYPDSIHFESTKVICCSELRQNTIPLFLVGHRGEGKLPLEVSALVDFQPSE